MTNIPKIIHYCWFGKGLIPASHKECIKSWQKHLPGWEIKCWNENNFDIDSFAYAREAYTARKYAFVADVARLHALYNFGGIYLDTDVELYKPLDIFLKFNFFTGIEIYKESFNSSKINFLNDNGYPLKEFINKPIPWLGLLSSVIGSKPGNLLIKDCLDYYSTNSIFKEEKFNPIIIDGLLAMKALSYGFRYKDEYQELKEGITIFPSNIFAYDGGVLNEKSVLYHHAAQSWKPKSSKDIFLLRLDKLHLLTLYKKCGSSIRKIFRNNKK